MIEYVTDATLLLSLNRTPPCTATKAGAATSFWWRQHLLSSASSSFLPFIFFLNILSWWIYHIFIVFKCKLLWKCNDRWHTIIKMKNQVYLIDIIDVFNKNKLICSLCEFTIIYSKWSQSPVPINKQQINNKFL